MSKHDNGDNGARDFRERLKQDIQETRDEVNKRLNANHNAMDELVKMTEEIDSEEFKEGSRAKVPPAPKLTFKEAVEAVSLNIPYSRASDDAYVTDPDPYDVPSWGDPKLPQTPEPKTDSHHDPDPGRKFDGDKPNWMLVPMHALDEIVQVLTYGAKKYSPDNWRKVPGARARYGAAMLRHVIAYVKGEARDPETNFHHLAHAACCLLYLMEFDRLDLNP